jgi:YYY domain-containing protein
MTETLTWWLCAQLLGIAAFPLTFHLFRRLPDGGYAFTKIVGLLFVAYLYWLAVSLEVLPNERLTIVALTLLVAAVAGAVAYRSRTAIRETVVTNWPVFLAVDALFLSALAVGTFLRAYVPEIDGTEKPMDFAFLNAVLRADSFPPEDPWLAGHGISYYYFGHLMTAMMTSLTSVAPASGYNLGVALVAALAASAIFGLVWNLVSLAGRTRLAYFGATAAVVFLLLLANWEGLFEFLAVHNAMPGWLYDFLDIDGLEGPNDSGSWYPTEFWFWWRASRIVSGWTIREFPFFSYLLGDLHAHVLALPFFITSIAFALNLFREPFALGWRTWTTHPLPLSAGALLVGSLIFLNAWDFPTIAFVLGLVAVVVNLRHGLKPQQAVLGAAAVLLPLLALALVLYAPFLTSFGSAAKFIAPVMVTNSPSYVVEQDMVSHPVHLLIAWGPLLWLVGLFVTGCLLLNRSAARQNWQLAALPLLVILPVWVGAVLYDSGFVGLLDEIAERGVAWLSFILLAALLIATGAASIARFKAPDAEAPLLFALGLAWTGLLLILGSELFYVEEFAAARLNTVFKLSFQAWLLLAASSAFGICHLWLNRSQFVVSMPRWPQFELSSKQVWWGFTGVSALFVAAALVYPVIATANRTEGLTRSQTLDGLEYVRDLQPNEYEAVAWLRDNVEGAPVILEAPGPDWGDNARISWRTGLPTVIGWPSHEFIWRGTWSPQAGREADVNSIYISDDQQRVEELLDKYDVRYIVVGSPEQALYGIDVLSKFHSVAQPVVSFGILTIYEVRSTPSEVATRP